jgi:Predicted membrane protein
MSTITSTAGDGSPSGQDTPAANPPAAPSRRTNVGGVLVGLIVVVGLAALTRYLDKNVPVWTADTAFGKIAKSIEYPVYAIAIGLAGNVILSALRVRDLLAPAFRTEFFIKTGLVLLGISVNLSVIWKAAGPAIVQALLLITSVFFFAWWLGGKLGLDEKLRALLGTAVSICGVSAAIAAAGAVKARREQLAYAASLVIVFALPSIFLLPWLADVLNLRDVVAGAWIGGNIDTTAAVAAAGAIVGEDALQIATIVKTTQNALIGVVAVALTAYFAFRVAKPAAASAGTASATVEGGTTDAAPSKPGLIELWRRFPKFVLGFIAASAIGTWYATSGWEGAKDNIATLNNLRTLFLILAFVSIGLEFRVKALRQAGWRPIVVFGAATIANIVLALGLASILFRNVTT